MSVHSKATVCYTIHKFLEETYGPFIESGSRKYPYFPRSRRDIRTSCHDVFRRQGFFRPAASCTKSLLSVIAAVPDFACGYELEVPRDDCVPQSAYGRTRGQITGPPQRRGNCQGHQRFQQRFECAHPRTQDRGVAASAGHAQIRLRNRRCAS